MSYMAWLDLETSGLNPPEHYILEIGVMITDTDLNEVARTNVVITDVPLDSVYAKAPVIVQEMHTKSGLWEAIRTAQKSGPGMVNSLYVAYNEIRRLMETYFGEDKPPMCGSSVHFDRSFLRHDAPRIEKLFGYRNLDVSTIKELAERWAPNVWATRPGQKDEDRAHRVVPDLRATLAELRHYRDSGFIGGAGCECYACKVGS